MLSRAMRLQAAIATRCTTTMISGPSKIRTIVLPMPPHRAGRRPGTGGRPSGPSMPDHRRQDQTGQDRQDEVPDPEQPIGRQQPYYTDPLLAHVHPEEHERI